MAVIVAWVAVESHVMPLTGEYTWHPGYKISQLLGQPRPMRKKPKLKSGLTRKIPEPSINLHIEGFLVSGLSGETSCYQLTFTLVVG